MTDEFKIPPGLIPPASPSTRDLKPPLTANQLFEACDAVWMYQMDGHMHANVKHKSLAMVIERTVKINPDDETEAGRIETEILNEFDWELKLPDGTEFRIPDQECKFGEGIFYEYPQETMFDSDTFVNLKTDKGQIVTLQFWFTIPHNVDMIWTYLDRQADHARRGQQEHQDVTVDTSDDTSHLEPDGDDLPDLDIDDFTDTQPGDL